MGGQACVLYGAAEFSRDTDLVISPSADNLARLEVAMKDLQADRIAVPPMGQTYLDSGLAVHFRCRHPEAAGPRVDIMTTMRGVDPFPALWERRSSLEVHQQIVEVLALPDLVRAKKTQRDKDWPMLSRLVESNYFTFRHDPNEARIHFWLTELRNAALLLQVGLSFPQQRAKIEAARPLLSLTSESELRTALLVEEAQERALDVAYWLPLKAELERLRRQR
jgi:hypothetical protein